MLDFGGSRQLVSEIVFTGGSCAGKTSALGLVARALRERGHSVLTAPEAVTMLVSAGMPDIGDISRNDLDRGCRFQREVFRVQRTLRETFIGVAGLFLTDHVVILYDRGELDALAYHPHDCIAQYAATEGTTLDAIRNSYTAVMHLVTAADGAEAAFSSSGNAARWDTPEEAVRSDITIRNIWAAHPRHCMIDNSTDFIGKIDRLVAATLAAITEHARAATSTGWNSATI